MLDPRIEVIRKQYDLRQDDFWPLPQKRKDGTTTWLVKHAALEVVAAKAGLHFDAPQIIEADGGNGIAALWVRGHDGDRSIWSIGEASPKNCKNAYPWAIAEKRAIDRVILKLVGLHGLVYSEDEMDNEERKPPSVETKPAPKKTIREENYPVRPGWEWQSGDPKMKSSYELKQEGYTLEWFTAELDIADDLSAMLEVDEPLWSARARKDGLPTGWRHVMCERLEARENELKLKAEMDAKAELIAKMPDAARAGVPLGDALKASLAHLKNHPVQAG